MNESLSAARRLTFAGAVASGKLKVLAVPSPARSAIFPEVPPIAQSGFPGFEASAWYALVAPAKTPRKAVREDNIKPD